MITYTRNRAASLWSGMKEVGRKTHLFIHNYHHPLRGIIAVLIFTAVIVLIVVVIIGFTKAQEAREATLEDINRKTDAQTMMICILMRAEPDMTPVERKEVNKWCEDEIERLQDDRESGVRDPEPSPLRENIQDQQELPADTESSVTPTDAQSQDTQKKKTLKA